MIPHTTESVSQSLSQLMLDKLRILIRKLHKPYNTFSILKPKLPERIATASPCWTKAVAGFVRFFKLTEIIRETYSNYFNLNSHSFFVVTIKLLETGKILLHTYGIIYYCRSHHFHYCSSSESQWRCWNL